MIKNQTVKMFRPAFQYYLFLFILSGFQQAFSFVSPQQDKTWLKQYSDYKQQGDVYVVKKIDVSCRSYESFLLDRNGNKLSPAVRDIGEFSDGLAEFVPIPAAGQKQALHGFMNKRGKIVIPPIYLGTDKFYKGKTWVIYPAGRQYGLSYIDTTGKLIYKIPIQYFKKDFLISNATVDFVCNYDTKEDVIWWRKGKIFLLNWNFSPYIEAEIKKAKGIYHFLYEGKYGIIDKDFILRIPVALDDIDPEYKFSGQGLERVKNGEKYGFINVYTGELVTPFEFSDTRKPTSGLFWVKKNNKWGCIDKTGKVRIPFLYDEASGFTRENRAAVAINGKFGHIDKSGKVRIPLKFDFASYFNNGLSMIRIKDKYGYMDSTGRYVTEIKYDNAFPFDRKTTIAERLGLRYELSLDGRETFIGFTDEWKAIFILIGLLLFVAASNYLFKRKQKSLAAKK
jgi:hypothetical protein